MRLDSRREWDLFVGHAEGCPLCQSALDAVPDGEMAPIGRVRLCGEGQELLNVARLHTREEMEQAG